MKTSKAESIREAIMKAIENNDFESARELVEHWESKYYPEKDDRCIFLHTKLQVLMKLYEQTENADERVERLSKAIETGNEFFAANEAAEFPMDNEVQVMWFQLVDHWAGLCSFYQEGTYDDEDGLRDDEDCFDEDEEEYPDIFHQAIQARIGTINQPNLKPKPPRKYDGSLKSRLLKAIDCHMEEYGDLDSCNMNLLRNICEQLDIDSEDFLNSIYDY